MALDAGRLPWPKLPKCSRCTRPAIRGLRVCYVHGGYRHVQDVSPERRAARAALAAVRDAERNGEIPAELLAHPAWLRAGRKRHTGPLRLTLMLAWGNPEAWAQAIACVP